MWVVGVIDVGTGSSEKVKGSSREVHENGKHVNGNGDPLNGRCSKQVFDVNASHHNVGEQTQAE